MKAIINTKLVMEDGIIFDGALTYENGKIIQADQADKVQIPADAEIIDAGGRLVTPGCVEAHCHIGLDNEGMGWEGHDYNEIVEPLTPHLRAIDAINPQDRCFREARQGGVTTVLTGPGRVWLQTMPIINVANAIRPYIPTKSD